MAVANQPIYPIICGPTASGKSAIAMRLAEQFPVEIISADSRQVIKHLDIGTAKPTKAEQEKVPVHLIDLIEPGEKYSAVRFAEDTDRVIEQVLDQRKLPVVVGGTGLYLKALTEGLVIIDQEVTQVREQLEAEALKLGPDKMHAKLAEIDPEEAARIHPNNLRRVLRALEIFHQTGQIKSELIDSGSYKKSANKFEYFCIAPPREELYERINRRVDIMIAAGWLDELQSLIKAGIKANIRKAEVIGYAELLDYLDNKATLDDTLDMIRQNTRRFAKRQMTWYRGLNLSRFYQTEEECYSALSEFVGRQSIF